MQALTAARDKLYQRRAVDVDRTLARHGRLQRIGARRQRRIRGVGIRGAQRVLKPRRAQRTIIPVEFGVEVPAEFLLDLGWQSPSDYHRGTGGHFTPTLVREGRFERAAATVEPSSAGLGATVRPAVRMISAFSAAVSPKAEMIAPA